MNEDNARKRQRKDKENASAVKVRSDRKVGYCKLN